MALLRRVGSPFSISDSINKPLHVTTELRIGDVKKNDFSRTVLSGRRIRELTRRTRAVSPEDMMKQFTVYLRGWQG